MTTHRGNANFIKLENCHVLLYKHKILYELHINSTKRKGTEILPNFKYLYINITAIITLKKLIMLSRKL